MTSPRGESMGSRTAAYVVAGFLAGPLVWFVALGFVGLQGATALVVVLWCTGVAWLLKKRQDDPGWDSQAPR